MAESLIVFCDVCTDLRKFSFYWYLWSSWSIVYLVWKYTWTFCTLLKLKGLFFPFQYVRKKEDLNCTVFLKRKIRKKKNIKLNVTSLMDYFRYYLSNYRKRIYLPFFTFLFLKKQPSGYCYPVVFLSVENKRFMMHYVVSVLM